MSKGMTQDANELRVRHVAFDYRRGSTTITCEWGDTVNSKWRPSKLPLKIFHRAAAADMTALLRVVEQYALDLVGKKQRRGK